MIFLVLVKTLVLTFYSMQHSFSVESKKDFRIARFLMFSDLSNVYCVCDT